MVRITLAEFRRLPAERRGAVTKLNAAGHGLTTFPLAECLLLPALEEIDLCDNHLATLPPEICRLADLKNLKELHLDNNQLTELPAEIWELKALEVLYLAANQLTAVSPAVGQLKNLKMLCVSFNQLTTVPAEIGQLKALEMLDLGNNELTEVPAVIGELPKLDWLDLVNNPLAGFPLYLGPVPAMRYFDIDKTTPRPVPQRNGQSDLQYLREHAPAYLEAAFPGLSTLPAVLEALSLSRTGAARSVAGAPRKRLRTE